MSDAPTQSATCAWSYNEWHDYFSTTCEQAVCFPEADNGSELPEGYKYCPYCGREIEVKREARHE